MYCFTYIRHVIAEVLECRYFVSAFVHLELIVKLVLWSVVVFLGLLLYE